MNIHKYVHTHTHTHTHTHVWKLCVYTRIPAKNILYTRTYAIDIQRTCVPKNTSRMRRRRRIHMGWEAYTCIYTYMCTLNIRTCTSACLHVRTCVYTSAYMRTPVVCGGVRWEAVGSLEVLECMYVYMHLYEYLCMHAHVHIPIHVCM